jgi:type IV secretory pathway VirB2 component (pilin)
MRRYLLAVAATASLVAVAPAASATPPCQGGVSDAAKPVLHTLEGPVAGTPAEDVIHAVECSLP